MADPSITATRSEDRAPTLFQAALGKRWRQLPRSVQRLHSVQDRETISGRARQPRRDLLARLAAYCFGLPTAADDVELIRSKARTAHGEVWQRDFAGRSFARYCRPPSARGTVESFGALSFEQALLVENATFVVERGWCLGVPIPSVLLPRSCAKEFAVNDDFHFDVGL
jgi:hypothetical protein